MLRGFGPDVVKKLSRRISDVSQDCQQLISVGLRGAEGYFSIVPPKHECRFLVGALQYDSIKLRVLGKVNTVIRRREDLFQVRAE